jgi:spermidine synthase
MVTPAEDSVAARIAATRMLPGPARFGLGNPLAVLGSELAGPATLARWSAPAPLNTDDHPVVAYLAPRATYEPEATPAERLLSLLAAWEEGQPASADRVAAYRRARTAFLRAGLGVLPSADPARMLQQVREPLLDVLRLSPDFEPAYQPLLRLAVAWHPADPAGSEALLQDLARVAPAAPGARRALQELRSAPATR